MSRLSMLPNVGKVLEEYLIAVGADSPEKLQALGAREAFLRIRFQKDASACINMLYGIQGAIDGIHKRFLSDQTKEELKSFYHSL